MLLGRYDRLAIDTELIRHLKMKHPRRRFTPAQVQSHYAPWHPHQFLAYWCELWSSYEARHGRSDSWSLDHVGRNITRVRKQSVESRLSRSGAAS